MTWSDDLNCLSHSLIVQGNITDLLGVRADTGHIFLTRIAREQEVGSEVTAVVVATDGGPSPLSGSTQVIVQLLNCSQDPFRYAGCCHSNFSQCYAHL